MSEYNLLPFISSYISHLQLGLLLDNPNPFVLNIIRNIYLPDTIQEELQWRAENEEIDEEYDQAYNPNWSFWEYISAHPDAIDIIEEHIDFMHWDALSTNPAAFHLLQANIDKIDYEQLLLNPHPDIIKLLDIYQCEHIDTMILIQFLNNHIGSKEYDHLLRDHLDAILERTQIHSYFWSECKNLYAINLLKERLEIDWTELSKNPIAIHILNDNPDKIDWSNLCMNEAAFDLIMANQKKIDWKTIFYNDNEKFKPFLMANSKKLTTNIRFNILINEHPEWKLDLMTERQLLYSFRSIENDSDHLYAYFINCTIREIKIFEKRKYFNECTISFITSNPRIFIE